MIETKELELLLCGSNPNIKIKDAPQHKPTDFNPYKITSTNIYLLLIQDITVAMPI